MFDLKVSDFAIKIFLKILKSCIQKKGPDLLTMLLMLLCSGRQENLINHPGRNSKRLTPEVGTKTYPPPWVVTNNYFAYGSYRNMLSQ